MTDDQSSHKADRERFMAAWEAWAATGVVTVTCDSCGSVIRFAQTGTAISHDCDCGKYTGTLRS